jgi:hypothetical protein
MATEHPIHIESLIEPPPDATPVLPDEEKAAAAEQEAVQAKEAKPSERFVEYVVPRRASTSYVDEHGKRRPIVTRPSDPHAYASVADDGSYASRVGVASARAKITPHDWASNGISGATETLVWDFDNDWRVPARKLSAEQIDFLLTDDARINKLPSPRFELVDGNGNKVDN